MSNVADITCEMPMPAAVYSFAERAGQTYELADRYGDLRITADGRLFGRPHVGGRADGQMDELTYDGCFEFCIFDLAPGSLEGFDLAAHFRDGRAERIDLIGRW
jgi:hypothetical protein